MNARQYAFIWVALWIGILKRRPGIVPVTALATTLMEKFFKGQRIVISRRLMKIKKRAVWYNPVIVCEGVNGDESSGAKSNNSLNPTGVSISFIVNLPVPS